MSRIKADLRHKRSCQYMVQLDTGLSGRVFSHSSSIKGPLDEQQLSLFQGVCWSWILLIIGLLHSHSLMIDELQKLSYFDIFPTCTGASNIGSSSGNCGDASSAALLSLWGRMNKTFIHGTCISMHVDIGFEEHTQQVDNDLNLCIQLNLVNISHFIVQLAVRKW